MPLPQPTYHQAPHFALRLSLRREPTLDRFSRGADPPAVLAFAALVVAAALWGVATSGTKYALRAFGPLTLLAVELLAATIALWAVAVIRGGGRGGSWRLAAVLGLLEPALAYAGDTAGLTRTSAANASVIIGLESTFVVVLAAVFLRERIGRSLFLAVGAGLLGLLALEQVSWLTGPALGDLFVVGGALSAAAYTIVARRIDPAIDSLTLTAQQFAAASAAVLPAALSAWASGSEAVPEHVPARFWIAAVLVGIGGFGVSFLIYNWAITVVAAGSAAVIINLIPAFGLMSAVAWLGEPLTAGRLAGASLIAASVAIFTWVQVREHRQAPLVDGADAAAETCGRDELASAVPAAASPASDGHPR